MEKKTTLIEKVFIALTILVTVFLLAVTIKGNVGSPISFQKERDSRVTGPFESTNSSSRYALIQAMVDNNTYFFTDELAKFSAPDITYYNGKYFSIFTPGVSFLGIPFYMFGKYIGFPQLTTYVMNLLFLLANFFLIIKIAKKFGATTIEGLFGAFIFIFATNSLAYALTLTQHQLSTTLILLGLLNAFAAKRTFFNNIFLGALFGIGLLVDIPNLFAFLPIIIYVFFKHFTIAKLDTKYNLKMQVCIFGFLVGILPFLFLFGQYNHALTGSYTKLGQTIGRSDYPHNSKKQKTDDQVAAKEPAHALPLDTRGQLHSMYILFTSDERGVIYYSPVIIAGLLGLLLIYRKSEKASYALLALATVSMIAVLYSMHGDPWGGWSYGSRYMIPVCAILAAGLGILVRKYKKNIPFLLVFTALLLYSLYVSILGAITTNAIPPKVEALSFKPAMPYTYLYNQQFAAKDISSSLVYNLFLESYFSVNNFLYVLIALSASVIGLNYILILLRRESNEK